MLMAFEDPPRFVSDESFPGDLPSLVLHFDSFCFRRCRIFSRSSAVIFFFFFLFTDL